jgi:hypothetical protein
MTQLTVRDVDERLGEALKREADARGMSVNRLVLQLLRESLGLAPSSELAAYTDLDHLAGTWSAEDAAEFERRLAGQRSIDESLWR